MKQIPWEMLRNIVDVPQIDPEVDPRISLAYAIPPLLNGLSEYFNVSGTVAVHMEAWEKPVAFVYGYDDYSTGSKLTLDTVIPQGSVTKSFTVATLMQLVEVGKVKLDDVVHPYVDDVLKSNGTSMMELWNDPRILEVTFGQLAGMQSGLFDYNDTDIRILTFLAKQDVLPLDYIHMVDKKFWCDPGTCASYTTVGMIILGLALAGVQGAKDWTEFDQTQIFPRNYTGIYFPQQGACEKYPNMAHQYLVMGAPSFQAYDITSFSCANSWTGGNIAGTASDLSMWWVDLFSNNAFKNSDNLKLMTEWKAFDYYFAVGSYYGLGLEGIDTVNFTNPDSDKYWFFPGHGGADYGSWGVGGWNEDFNFGFHMGITSSMGMNVSLENPTLNYYATGVFQCYIYNTILQVFSKQELPVLPCVT